MLPTGPHVPVRRITPEATSLGDLFRRRAKRSATSPAMYEHRGGSWRAVTWGEFYARAKRAAKQLRAHGVGRGDKIAILGPTQPSWAVFDMAAQLLGAVSFGIYPKQTPTQIRYLLEHSEAKVVLVSGKDELASVLEAAAGVATLGTIAPWEKELVEGARAKDPRVAHVDPEAGEGLDEDEVDESLSQVPKEATAIFVYTSGTTGPPKGAMISHENILTLLHAQHGVTEIWEDDLSLNFLPMAHSAERIFGFFGRIDAGIATAYARSMGTVLEDLADVKPTLFGAVPRIFEKAYGKMQAELAKKPAAVQKLFAWAVSVGKRAAQLELRNQPVPLPLRVQRKLAARLVYRKIQGAFGGRVRYFVTGAAPIAMEILEMFWAVGLPIYEVYGMTEATVCTHVNRPGETRLGTVGRPLPGLESKLAEDGEILIRAPWVFQGYFKAEEATKDALQNGWLHTGDVGTVDRDGFYKITDRKKHLIITAGGKNLAPANIENALKAQDPLISQVYAHGDKRPYVVAILAPSPLETLDFGKDRGLVDEATVKALTKELLENPAGRSDALNRAMAKVAAHPDFVARMEAAVARGNRDLAQVEQVRRFAVLDRDFSQEAGELTPTMKLKRKAMAENHAALLDAVYDGTTGHALRG